MTFSGSIPALITPFENGKLDRKALAFLVEWHIQQGSSALVVCGTTGESPALTHEERSQIIGDAVKAARGRIPIIAGAGSNSTQKALDLTRAAEDAGADGLLHVTGYYNKPNQSQVIEHFRALNNATRLPILVYNIPSRTGQELTVETMVALAEMDRIAGVKDSTSNLGRVILERQKISKPFAFLSGDDATSLAYVASGGHGCITITANVIPKMFSQMIAAALQGDFRQALVLQDRMMPLHTALFLEPSPAGTKYALATLDLCANELRMPLCPATAAARAAIDRALANVDVNAPKLAMESVAR
jgi:4-hydroxy-tetrahydrodipicolinate synthase